jgi:CubicO group peptidase (beta-lactamase class C family)
MTMSASWARWSVAAIGMVAMAATAVQGRRSAADGQAIDRAVEEYRVRHHVPGIAVAVTQGRARVRVGGYGHDSTGAVITAATRLPIASLSKSFTALAVMQLVDEGRVRLDDPVRTYLPDFAIADPRGADITVRQVLTHTSGLADTTFHEKSGPLPASLAEGVALLRSARLASAPGEKEHYHNPNYWIAARIVEVVSGRSFGDYLRERVFLPLGMTRTSTVTTLRQTGDVARGHVRVLGRAFALPEPDWFLDGASGVVTTADDLAQWLVMQNGDGTAPDGTRVISADALRAMHDGLGWRRSLSGAATVVQHGGWLFTFTAHQMLLPDSGYGIAVIANVGLGLAPADAEAVAQDIARIVTGGTPDPGTPVGAIVDVVLVGLAALVVVFGVRQWRRVESWTDARARHARWRRIVACWPWIVPLVVLLLLPATLSFVFGGRDATYLQMLYVAPMLVCALIVMAIMGLALTAVRAFRRAGPSGPAGAG